MSSSKTRDRTKACDRCYSVFPVLYRVRYEATAQWHFICPNCLPEIKSNNPFYAYGGTWKARKDR
ncbi:MAG: hypothetical protein WBA57_07800 [Elainellaceae cyanobacterium]